MLEIQDLIAHWRQDPARQRRLLELIARIVAPTLRKALGKWKTSRDEFNDVLQEFFLYELRRNWVDLDSFSGSSQPQFSTYWRKIAWHFANRHLSQSARRDDRETSGIAKPSAILAPPAGGSETEIAFVLRELIPQLKAAERQLLLRILGDADSSASTTNSDAKAGTLREPSTGQSAGTRDIEATGMSRHASSTRIARLRARIAGLLFPKKGRSPDSLG